jgi:hypothetical protein
MNPASLVAAPFQFHSRLFGQIKPCLKIPRIGRNLVLLGDCFPMYGKYINDSLQLRDYVSYGWDRVFIVPGLVELAGNGLRPWLRNMEDFQEIVESSPCKNMMIMNNSEVVLPEATLIGATFWPGMDQTPDQIIRSYPHFVKKHVNNWIEDDIEFMDQSIKMAIGGGSNSKQKTIVCTYFPVHGDMFMLPSTAAAMDANLKFIKGHQQ